MPNPIIRLFNAGQVVTLDDDDTQSPYIVTADYAEDDVYHVVPLGGDNENAIIDVDRTDATAHDLSWLVQYFEDNPPAE